MKIAFLDVKTGIVRGHVLTVWQIHKDGVIFVYDDDGTLDLKIHSQNALDIATELNRLNPTQPIFQAIARANDNARAGFEKRRTTQYQPDMGIHTSVDRVVRYRWNSLRRGVRPRHGQGAIYLSHERFICRYWFLFRAD